MINVGRLDFEIECPRCRFSTQVFLQEVVQRDILICRGCKASIRLEDQMNEARRIQRRLQRSLTQLEDTLRAF